MCGILCGLHRCDPRHFHVTFERAGKVDVGFYGPGQHRFRCECQRGKGEAA
jgi:hypothetical protein